MNVQTLSRVRLAVASLLVLGFAGCNSSVTITNESDRPMSYNYRSDGLEHSITLQPGQQIEIPGPTTVRFPPGAAVSVR